jgi:copper chaperone CopZ
MKKILGIAILTMAVAVLSAASAPAATRATIEGVHICCAGCTKAIEAGLKKVEDLEFNVDSKKQVVLISAGDLKTAQKGIDALAAAGFHGKVKSDAKKLHFKPVKPPKGKVTRLEVEKIHNCCLKCTKAIQAALAKVEGVEADSAKPKVTKFAIEGNFSAAEAIEAIFNAGFHCRIVSK